MNAFMKIFQSNVKKTKLINKAEQLVQLANVHAIGSQINFFQKFPQLRTASQIKHWDLFCTVSLTYAAFIRVSSYVKNRKLIEQIDKITLKNIGAFHPNGIYLFEDIEKAERSG